MSNWTHVAAIVRVDDLRLGDSAPDFDKIFGTSFGYLEDIPSNPMPFGTEGSLQKQVWDNPQKECAAAYTVSIFGDLRSHDDPEEILEWFKKCLETLIVRQATITIENEWNGTINWTYTPEI